MPNVGDISPLSGKPFSSQEEIDSYLQGEEWRAGASGRDSAYPSAYAGTYEDWSKNSIYATPENQYKWSSTPNMMSQESYYTPTGTQTNKDTQGATAGWAVFPNGGGSGARIYKDASGNWQITWSDQYGQKSAPVSNYGNSSNSESAGDAAMLIATGGLSALWGGGGGGGSSAGQTPSQQPSTSSSASKSALYNPSVDYGLGANALGVIPLATDASGNPTSYWAGVPGGGGSTFTDLSKAVASAQGYKQWYDGQNPAPKIPTQSEYLASKGYPAPSTGTDTTRGILADPLQGEKYYDTTKDFYTQATDAKKAYDQYGSQPPEAVQNWNKIEGEFASPWQSEQTWDKYAGTFSDPRYLDQYFDYQQKKAQANLEGRASAAGVGDSSAAMRATGNLGAEFSARKLAGMQDFAKTGMTLAGEADTAHGNRLSTGQTLAGTADTATNARINAAAGVDQAELARRLGGQTASTAAENLTLQRETGALTSATNISNDIASLVYGGVTQAQAQQFATQLQAIALKASQGQLTATAAYQQATELANSLGIIGNVATQYMIAQKLGGGSSSGGSSGGTVVGPVPSGA